MCPSGYFDDGFDPEPARLRAALARGRVLVIHPLLAARITLVGFLVDWVRSRPLPALLQGLPAIAGAVAIMMVLLLGWRQRDAKVQLVGRYLRSAGRAWGGERCGEAELLFRKAVCVDESSRAGKFGLALAAERRGDARRARRLMRSIAPEDGPGYAPAHFWLAKDLVRTRQKLARKEVELVEHDLRQVVGDDPGNAEAHEMLARVHFAQRELEQAAKHAALAAKQRPALLLLLARIRRLQGDASRAEMAAIRASEHYALRTKSHPEDAESRLIWAQAEAFLGRPADAERVLLQAVGGSNDRRFREALVKLYVGWFDQLNRSGSAAPGELLQLLERALRFGPRDPAVSVRLAMLAGAQGDAGARARAMLGEALAAGTAPVAVHVVLGASAASRGEWKTAVMHLEQAYRLQPQTPAVLNNLAWVAAHSDPPQVRRALELANAAAEIAPSHAEVRETRGQILFQMGRYREALSDLEFALQSMPDRGNLHETLAAIYQELGAGELAAEHRRLARVGGQGRP